MTNLAFSHAKIAASRRDDVNTSGKSCPKNFPAFISRNPLKVSILTRESKEIQTNPIAQKRGLSQPNGEAPRKSKPVSRVRCREGSKLNPFKWGAARPAISLVVVVMMMMVVVMIIVMMVVVVVIVMMIVMMIIFSHDHRLFFRHSSIIAALVLCAQNLLGIRDGLQQLGK